MSVTSDRSRSPGEPGPDSARSDEPDVAHRAYEQLTLAPTVIGPSMRTEDHYERGTKLKIKGERGTFTYRYASVSQGGLVSLHLLGEDGSRAVRPDQVVPTKKRRR